MSCRATALLVLLAAGCSGVSAAAQDVSYADGAPAHISFVDGTAVLERDGEADRTPLSMPLLAGDRVRTESGRLEVLFAGGSALHLDANTIVDFQSDEVVRLLQGRIRLSIGGSDPDVFYRVDAPSAWIEIAERGEYRIAVVGAGEVELAVLRGRAELVNEHGRSDVRAGERTFARAGASPSAPYVFNSAAWDGFDRWSEDRRAARLGTSAQYLPSDVRPYAGTFDHYGSWRHEPAHGYVWYPRVAAGWRPYHHGRWVTLRPYGWTWIASDPWGWPTHHYGRWGFSAGAWYWIPGRQWGPAWVSWAYATDYVSWCPLGWDNRPVFQINIFAGRRYSPWDAWTVVSRRHFGGRFVHVGSARTVIVDRRVHNTFVIRDRAPEARFAAGRDTAPIRSAGRYYAVPRGGGGAGVRATDSRRDPPMGGDAGRPTESRRFPAASRTPGSPVDRTADAAAPSTRSRAVSRDNLTSEAPGVSRRTSRTGSDPGTAAEASPSGRAVSRDPASAPTASAPGRSSAGADAPSAPPQDRGATGSGVRSRRSVAAPPVGQPPSTPTDVNRAASRSRPSTGAPAAASPQGADAATAAPPSRTRSSSAASAATTVAAPQPSAPSDGSRAVPAARSRSDTGAVRSRANPRNHAEPSAAPPQYRTVPERQAPAGSSPDRSYRVPERRTSEPSPAPPPSYRSAPERRAPGGGTGPSGPPPRTVERSAPAERNAPAAGGSSRRSGGEGSSGGRARPRE